MEIRIIKGKTCLSCPFQGNRIVYPNGSMSPEFVVVGEAPGKNEEKQGVPFIGKAGGVLDEILNENNISRDEIYITNVVKCRPPNNNIEHPDSKIAYEICRERLRKELKWLGCKHVITMGRIPLKALTDISNIGTYRGTVTSIFLGDFEIYVYPTFHPASIIYDKTKKERLVDDMSRFIDLIRRKLIK